MIDIMATCCDVAEAEYPKERGGREIHPMRGVSLVPAFRERAEIRPRTLYWEHEQHAAIREGDWKLVSLDASDDARWCLYNLANDCTELQDLAGSNPQRVASMKTRWTEWAQETNVLPWLPEREKR